MKPSAVVEVGGAEVGRAGAIGLSREVLDAFRFAPNVFVFHCWSIPKRGDDGTLEKFIAEKSNGSDELNDIDVLSPSPPQLYESKRDVEFRKLVIGDSDPGCCATPFCNMAGS